LVGLLVGLRGGVLTGLRGAFPPGVMTAATLFAALNIGATGFFGLIEGHEPKPGNSALMDANVIEPPPAAPELFRPPLVLAPAFKPAPLLPLSPSPMRAKAARAACSSPAR
jgi:hypothetical protein